MKLYAVILNPESLGVSDWSTQGRSNCENLVLFVVHDCGSVGTFYDCRTNGKYV